MIESVVVVFSKSERQILTVLATERGWSPQEFVRRLVLDKILPVRRERSNRGRVDTIAVKVKRLHGQGMTDQQIADNLHVALSTARQKRAGLDLLNNSTGTFPKRKKTKWASLSTQQG